MLHNNRGIPLNKSKHKDCVLQDPHTHRILSAAELARVVVRKGKFFLGEKQVFTLRSFYRQQYVYLATGERVAEDKKIYAKPYWGDVVKGSNKELRCVRTRNVYYKHAHFFDANNKQLVPGSVIVKVKSKWWDRKVSGYYLCKPSADDQSLLEQVFAEKNRRNHAAQPITDTELPQKLRELKGDLTYYIILEKNNNNGYPFLHMSVPENKEVAENVSLLNPFPPNNFDNIEQELKALFDELGIPFPEKEERAISDKAEVSMPLTFTPTLSEQHTTANNFLHVHGLFANQQPSLTFDNNVELEKEDVYAAPVFK